MGRQDDLRGRLESEESTVREGRGQADGQFRCRIICFGDTGPGGAAQAPWRYVSGVSGHHLLLLADVSPSELTVLRGCVRVQTGAGGSWKAGGDIPRGLGSCIALGPHLLSCCIVLGGGLWGTQGVSRRPPQVPVSFLIAVVRHLSTLSIVAFLAGRLRGCPST